MTRYLCWVAVFGVAALPDWASACWHHRAAYHSYYAAPVYPMYPVYPVYPQPCCPPPVCMNPPVPAYPMAPPRVEAVPKAAPPGMGTATPKDSNPPQVRPAGGTDTAVSPLVPVAPSPKKAEPAAALTDPSPLPKFPVVDVPKDLGPLPKLDVPKDPDFTPIPVPKDMPTDNAKPAIPRPAPAPDGSDGGFQAPRVPAPGGAAIPTPAPAFPEGLIPSPSVPELPDPKKPHSLPSLTLPPDSPAAPKGSTSRSSPLSAERTSEATVNVFPAQAARGEEAGNGYKTVGFYNHTARDVNLTIEGRAVKLPAKTYLYAKLGPTFTWGHGDNALVREAVPAGASGVDVVFRE